MAPTCHKCGNTKHIPGAQYCIVCGAALPAGPPPAPAGPAPAPAGLPRAPTSPSPMLVVSGSGRRYRMNPQSETLIGSRGCAIMLSDPRIAPQHARVSPSGGGFVIEDLGGGTQVNGLPIGGPIALKPNDAIGLGAVTLVYQGPTTFAGVAPQPPAAVQPHQPQPPAVIPPQAVAQPYSPQPTGTPLKNGVGLFALWDGKRRRSGSCGSKMRTRAIWSV